jgi:hypothetical protein
MANFRINRDAREQPIVWHGAIVQVLTEDAKTISEGCREHIICPVFVARDLSGLGWSLKEGHYDAGTGTTGGETDAV